MKVVILAGGLGTRISEESGVRPKPMVEIGGMPILWHIMKIYSSFNINEFVICLGYKGYVIKEYFANYFLHMSDVTIDLKNNQFEYSKSNAEPWKITLVDTGEKSMTGGRLLRVRQYVGDSTFMLTYGDGLAKVNIESLLSFHRNHGKLASVTAVRPPGRFGSLAMEGDFTVKRFEEKPLGDGGWINGGFFVFEPGVFSYLRDDSTVLEQEPLRGLASEDQLRAFKLTDFWQPVDTLRDKNYLNSLWEKGDTPWRVWR